MLLCWPSAAHADPAAPLFDTGQVANLEITLPAESKAALEADPGTYQPASWRPVDGTRHTEMTVGLRLKGHSTFQGFDGKPAFKIKLNQVKGQTLLGLKKLTLNNMVLDASMVHETLAYDTFRAMGVPAPRTGYAFVRVNGEPYGVYLNVETLDDVSLPRGSPPPATCTRRARRPPTSARRTWSATRSTRARPPSARTCGRSSRRPRAPGGFSDRMAGTADLPEMVRMWAVEKYIGHWDGYAGDDGSWLPNNYYLHSTTGGMFSMLPWGIDQTWAVFLGFDSGGLLFKACRADPRCDADFRRALLDVGPAIDRLDLAGEVDRLAGLLAPYQADDPRRQHDAAQATTELDGVNASSPRAGAGWTRGRPAGCHSPRGPAGPRPARSRRPPAAPAPPPRPPRLPGPPPHVWGWGPTAAAGRCCRGRCAFPAPAG